MNVQSIRVDDDKRVNGLIVALATMKLVDAQRQKATAFSRDSVDAAYLETEERLLATYVDAAIAALAMVDDKDRHSVYAVLGSIRDSISAK